MKDITAYIAIGSNQNNPVAQIRAALLEIMKIPNTTLHLQSKFYRTPPIGYAEQPDFINGVISVRSLLSPQDLLLALQDIENKHGRIREFKNGPRTIDLDLLLHGEQAVNTSELVLPHPAMTQRAFVLKPLADIAPDLVLHDGKTVLTHLARHCTKDFVQVEIF